MEGLILSIGIAQGLAGDTGVIEVVRAYLGPEVMMPVASAIAAGVGVILIFWQKVTTMVRSTYRRLFSRKDADDDVYTDTGSSLDADPGN